MATKFAEGFWRLADPKISLASAAGILLGASAAAAAGPIAVGWLLMTVLGVFAVEVAKNASGEVFDWDSGTDLRVREEDRSPFSGGKRVLVDGLLTRGQTWVIAAGGYLVAAVVGLLIVGFREPSVLWIGLAGMALAFFYHAPPFRLAYRGLGELAVAVSYGPLVCVGTYLVQRETIPTEVVLLSLPLGVLVAAFLWINEFPDYSADALSGKRTLVVRLGRRRAALGFAWLGAISALLVASLPMAGLSPAVWLGGVALLRYLPAARTLIASAEDTAAIIPAQAMTLQSFLLYAAGASAGMLIGR
ncbi:MAG: prenyltransferase [Gemmatimonadota bacterium]|jgi:1,4-dihydroxy-2-naphthoate octaprenyltransferase|nr:prenyltransferase [Gemmatimonadota bacterium]